MNFKISKKEFVNIITLLNRAISSNTPLPSLSGIKILVTENSLVFISSDSNISIKTCINNNDTNTLIINSVGEIVIDSKYLSEIVRKIDSEFINVEVIDGTLVKIFGGNSEFKINCMNSSDYPEINFDIKDEKPFKLSTILFNQIIDETMFACSTSETKPVLTGVNLKAKDNKIHANATDSYRLATKTIDIDSNIEFNITIPSKYLNEVYHSISDKKEVTIAIDNQKISFLFENTIISTRLLDDEFPDVEKLIPSSYQQKLIIDSKKLIDAIDRVSIMKAEGKNTIKMKIDSKNIEMTSFDQIGQSFETIPVITYEGDPLEISCSAKYLIDAIKALSSDEIIIEFSGELKPMIIKDNENTTLIQLISPVRSYH